MECKFRGCTWNKKGNCIYRHSRILQYEDNKENIVRCNKFKRRHRRNDNC